MHSPVTVKKFSEWKNAHPKRRRGGAGKEGAPGFPAWASWLLPPALHPPPGQHPCLCIPKRQSSLNEGVALRSHHAKGTQRRSRGKPGGSQGGQAICLGQAIPLGGLGLLAPLRGPNAPKFLD